MKIIKAEELLVVDEPSDMDGSDSELLPTARRWWKVPRMEVFSVRINNSDGEEPNDLYGTISMCNGGSDHQVIYNRKRGDYESFIPGEDTDLLLTGPASPFIGLDWIYIHLALRDEDEDEDEDTLTSSLPYSATDLRDNLLRDKPYCSWSNFTSRYDTLISNKLSDEFGSVTIHYIVFSDSLKAILEIRLLLNNNNNNNNRNGSDAVDVYGRVTARNSIYTNNESLIFRRRKGIHVSHGQILPLSRSVVAVPYPSSLIVAAHLWDHDEVSIANGIAEFPADDVEGTTLEKNISGRHGEILVKVAWSDNWY